MDHHRHEFAVVKVHGQRSVRVNDVHGTGVNVVVLSLSPFLWLGIGLPNGPQPHIHDASLVHRLFL